MAISGFISNLLTVLLIVVMLGIGLTMTIADLKQAVLKPQAVLLGLLAQTLILPALAFLIGVCLPLPSEFKIGLILLAASPGGPSSNLYSLLAEGDIALNLTLTTANSLLNGLTMPLFVGLALSLFAGKERVWVFPSGSFLELLVLIVIPTSVGIFVRSRWFDLAQRLAGVIKIVSVVALALTIAVIISVNWETLVNHLKLAGWVIALFNLLSLAVGYGVAKTAKLPRAQAIAISFEVGIHNGSLALFLAINVLKNQAYAIAPSLYSVLMYVTAGILCFYFNSTKKRKRSPSQQM